MRHRTLYLVCYDIADAGRLKAALDVSRRFATGGQKSVHECWLAPHERRQLLTRITRVIDAREDRVLIVALDPHRSVRTLGTARSPTDRHLILIGGPP